MKRLFFYKRKSKYPEDVTLDCKLQITQMDENFANLKDLDIAQANIINNKLVLERLDGTTIEVDLNGYLNAQNLIVDYNSIEGIVNIYDNDTLLFTIDKLITKDNINYYTDFIVAHDNTLVGNGNFTSPLSLSPLEETNFYPMVISFIDLTQKEKLPESPSYNDRYLIKQYYNPFGMLYNAKSVNMIANEVEPYGWRIPSLNDWNKTLNLIDCVKNHGENLYLCNKYFGKISGHLLKSVKYWNEPQINDDEIISPNNIKGIDKYNFNVVPCGKADESKNCTDFGNHTEFWTQDTNDISTDIYTKAFDFNQSGVGQYARNPNEYYSLRLVKDYTADDKSIMTINGLKYNTVTIGDLTWLAENVKFNETKYDAVNIPYVLSDLIAYYIIQWDGENWIKKEFIEGNRVIIKNAPNNESKIEYTLNNNNLEKITYNFSFSINENDKILSNDNNILSSSLNLIKEENESNDIYKLIGKNDIQIGESIIISKNTILSDIKFIESASEDDKLIDDNVIIGDPYLKFIFGDKVIYIPIKDMFIPYKAGNGINVNDNIISIKLNENNSNFLKVDENGLNLNVLDFKFFD